MLRSRAAGVSGGYRAGYAARRAHRGKRLQRLLEALDRHGREARADLAHPGALAGDAGVDHRRDAGLHHLADVDAERGAAELQPGQLVGLVLRHGDLVHLHRGLERERRRAAHVLDHRRGARHRERAQADRLGDRRVAHVGIGVVGTEAGEVDALDHRGRRGEPALARAAHPDARLVAVARDRGDDGAVGDAGAGVHDALASRHDEVEDEVPRVLDELERAGHFARLAHRHQVPRQRDEQQRVARLVAVVHLVAHLHRLRDDALDVDAPGRVDGPAQQRREIVVHPAQLLHHRLVVGAVPQHLADAHVERRVGVDAEAVVAHDVHLHRRGDDSRHRPDRVMVVARVEAQPAALREGDRLFRRLRPALEHAGPDDRPPHRPGHPVPRQRRSRVEHRVVAHAGHHVPREAQVDPDGRAFLDAVHALLIGVLDAHLIPRRPVRRAARRAAHCRPRAAASPSAPPARRPRAGRRRSSRDRR